MEEMQNTNEWVQANTNTTGSEVVMNTASNVSNDESPLGKLMGALGDLLLNNDDFTYQMMRQSCDYVNENIDLSEVDASSLVSTLHEEIKDSVLDELDYSRIVDSVHDDIDYREIARMVSDDYIDIYDIADRASEHIDGSNIAYELLREYSPTAICSTGQIFTATIKCAVEHLINTDSDFANIVRGNNQNTSVTAVEEINEIIDNGSDSELTDVENLIPSGIPAVTVQDHAIEALKRVVHEVLASYVPNYSSDPFMKIRVEAKSFDTFTDYMNGKW